jgi:hypothetical protein
LVGRSTVVDFIQPAAGADPGTGTASREGSRGLATIRDVLDAWAWNRGWPVATGLGRTRIAAEDLAERRGRPWSACTVRKRHRCVACGRRIRSGAVAYRPLREGLGVARHDRVCPRCINQGP